MAGPGEFWVLTPFGPSRQRKRRLQRIRKWWDGGGLVLTGWGGNVTHPSKEKHVPVGLSSVLRSWISSNFPCLLLNASSQRPSIHNHLGIFKQSEQWGRRQCPLHCPRGAWRRGGVQVDLPRPEGKTLPSLRQLFKFRFVSLSSTCHW